MTTSFHTQLSANEVLVSLTIPYSNEVRSLITLITVVTLINVITLIIAINVYLGDTRCCIQAVEKEIPISCYSNSLYVSKTGERYSNY